MKIPRNRPCPCGSGKKYKRCCGITNSRGKGKRISTMPPELAEEIRKLLAQQQAKELIRTQQQGLGKPVISTMYKGQRVVAVGNVVHFSKKWKTFPDFLSDYIKHVLGKEYYEDEMAKSFEDRHPMLQWCEQHHEFLKNIPKSEGKLLSATATGLVYCYLGLAYNLYLLSHNVELQTRLVNRLKRVDQFQGAYYELIIANSLIRAGFTLELEDETDEANKHCEFSALSQTTGQRFWVEAKSRSVEGILGKTKKDGVSSSQRDVTTRLTKQINEALAKPANGPRLIFIDVNADWTELGSIPSWVVQAERRLKAKETNLQDGKEAYVFITNCPFHRDLNSTRSGMEILGYGLGISDFGKSGHYRFSQLYKIKQKHIDAHNILPALVKYPAVPPTFEGGLPSETFKKDSQRCIIGETYHFEDIGIIGTIQDATIMEAKKEIFYIVRSTDGKQHFLSRPLEDQELEDYRRHPEAYFGVVKSSPKPIDDDFQFYEFIVNQYKSMPRSRMLAEMARSGDIERLESLDDHDLLLEYCERMVVSILPSNPRRKAANSED